MRKTLATLAILAASICSAYTNTVLVSTNTRAATEKWVSVRFEATLPSTPTNPASKYLNGNREWSSISLGHPQLSDFNGDVNYQHITTGQVAKLDYISDSGVLRVHDSAQPSRYFMEVVNSTGTVFEVTGPFTNLMVTLSDGFGAFINEEIGLVSPSWTSNDFPFIDGGWVGAYGTGTIQLRYDANGTAWSAIYPQSFPITLTGYDGNPSGTAAVAIKNIYYTTNVFAHFTTESELEAAKAACGVVLTNTVNGVVSNLTADIASATNALMPYARTLYGDLSATNESGYAAFNATNAAESYSALVPSSAVGSFTNIFRYNFNGVRKFGTLTNTARFLKSGFGAGYKAVSTVVSVKDAAGNVLASSASQPVNIDQTVTTQAAITNTLAIPLNIYSGTVEIACIAVSTNASFAVRLYSGAQYTNLLTFSEAPMEYATHTELRSLREEIPAIVMSNSVPQTIVRSIRTSETNIVVSSTNSVYYVALTNAANVSFDFSGLALGGTKQAAVTVYLDCLSTQALYSVIATDGMEIACQWEPTVTGRYEFAVSSDGVQQMARQVFPAACEWRQHSFSSYGLDGVVISAGDTVGYFDYSSSVALTFLKYRMIHLSLGGSVSTTNTTACVGYRVAGVNFYYDLVENNFTGSQSTFTQTANFMMVFPPLNVIDAGAIGYADSAKAPLYSRLRFTRTIIGETVSILGLKERRLNELERAAYSAGSFPSAFRLDY